MSWEKHEQVSERGTSATPGCPIETSLAGVPKWLFSIVLIIVTVLVYMPAWNGTPVWDDEAHMTSAELRSAAGLLRIWTEPGATQQYYPLVHSVFWLENKIWGSAVLPHHLVNILLHASAAVLLFRLLCRLQVPGAWLAAAVFALHPVHVESVAWISELKNTLSAVFFLAAALAYVRFDETRLSRSYTFAFCLFLLALMSKTVTAVLPAALLVLAWWKRGTISTRRDVLPLLPFFGIAVAAGLFTAWVEVHMIGARGSEFNLSFIERSLIAGRAFWFYLGKLFWPAELTFIYPRWEISAQIWWQYLFPLATLLLVASLYVIRRRVRAPLAAVLLFAGLLFPVLGFFNIYPFLYSFVADHFQYLASTAVIALSAAAIVLVLVRLRLRRRLTGVVLCGLLLCALGSLTWQQSGAYASAERLYRTTIARNPGCWMVYNNLANVLTREGRLDEALVHYQQAVTLRPHYVEAHSSLSNALLGRGHVNEAVQHAKAALAVDPDNADAHNNLGNALRQNGDVRRALEHYERAYAANSQHIYFQNNLASMLATAPESTLRNPHRALELAQRAADTTAGNDPIILHTLAAALAQNGRLIEARKTAQRGLEIASNQRREAIVKALQQQLAALSAPAEILP